MVDSNKRENRKYNIAENEGMNSNYWINGLIAWWGGFSLRTKLLAIATLVVSLLMTGITFFALNSIQRDAGMNDTRYARDLGLLLSGNVTELVANNQKKEISNVAEKFWRSSRNLRYIFFTDAEDIVQLGIPISATPTSSDSQFQLTRKLKLPSELKKRPQFPLVRQHATPQGQVTDVFVPMLWKGKYLGTLALGVTPNKKALASAALTREVTIAVFISIWVLVILGAVFNALTITRPVRELVRGVREISRGNFKSRISLPMTGDLGELLNGFNRMATQLENYDEANIEELKAAQIKQQSLIATMADGAILLDSEGKIVLTNPTAKRLFRWEGRFLEGKYFLNEIPEILSNDLHTNIESILKREKEKDDLRFSLGEPARTLRIVLQSVLDTNKVELKGIAVTIQDLTREVELNAAQNRFISNVSHELRTPLFNIKSYVETLHDLKDQLSDEEQIEFLGIANSETDRLTRLVNDVLDLSRLESCLVYHLNAVDIAQPIEQTLRTYHLNAKDQGIELNYEIEPNLPLVVGHYDLLLQVFANLVGNAMKFTESAGRIVIRAYLLESDIEIEQIEQGGWIVSPPPPRPTELHLQSENSSNQFVRIEISDTGSGIEPEDQEAIFERFFRVENRVHTLEGTGLGLSIVRNIIDKHHSKVNLVSELGIGTTFWFDLAVFEEKLVPEENKLLEVT